MTLALVLFEFGALLVYSAWTNRSLKALLLGDNQTAKAPTQPVTPGQVRPSGGGGGGGAQ